jgi:thiol-disulfide isomerase/thioredoxin
MRGRLALLLGAASAVGLGVKGARAWARRSKSRLRELPPDELWGALGVEPDGRPTVVAFSTPGCAVCRTTQAPALLDLESRLAGAVRVLRVDAALPSQRPPRSSMSRPCQPRWCWRRTGASAR